MNLQNINAYLARQNTVTTDSQTLETVTREAKNNINVMNLLGNIKAGDYLQGTIISLDGTNVTISLGEDNVILAKLNANTNLNVGANVVFSVRNSDSTGLVLSALFTNTDPTSTISKALSSAGLELNSEKNVVMVDSMMREGMNIGKDELIEMAKTIGNIETNDIPDAVTLSRLGIEPSPDNIEQFNAYKNYEHQVIGAVDNIMEMLPEEISHLIEDGDSMMATTITRDILDIFTASGTYEALDAKTMDISGMNVPTSNILDSNLLNEFVSLLKENGINEAFGEAIVSGQVSLGDTLFVLDDLINNYAYDRDASLDYTNATNSSLGNDFLEKLINIQKEEHSNVPNRILNLISSKPFSEILKASVNSQWKLTPEQVGEEKQVSNLYRRMTEQTSRLLETFMNQSKEDSPLIQEGNNLAKNMNFMNEMNNVFNYVQLPMRLSGNDAHGELYVYTNKKNLASNDGTVSALLHLDMDNLGPTDIYVSMNTSNNVNTHFYLPNEEALDLIAIHIDELNARLEKRGYNLSAQFSKKNEDTNIMSDIVAETKNSVPISFSNFDAKA